MDVGTVLGFVVGLGALVAAVLMDGGHLSSLFSASALLLIVGGTTGMVLISFPLGDVLKVARYIGVAFFPKHVDGLAIVDQLTAMAEKARREGLLSLESDARQAENPILARGLAMLVDGVDSEQMRLSLESEVTLQERRARGVAGILEAAGGYAPTVGIIGTVMGLVHVLGNLSDAEKLGPAIAIAFLATFYGIATANLFWLPLGTKAKHHVAKEALLGEMIIQGLVALQSGELPRTMRERLLVFLGDRGRTTRDSGDGGDKAGQGGGDGT